MGKHFMIKTQIQLSELAMSDEGTIDERILCILHGIAPDLIGIELDPQISIRDQVEFDSLDLMRFAHALESAFDVRISALDYPRLATAHGADLFIRQQLAQQTH